MDFIAGLVLKKNKNKALVKGVERGKKSAERIYRYKIKVRKEVKMKKENKKTEERKGGNWGKRNTVQICRENWRRKCVKKS